MQLYIQFTKEMVVFMKVKAGAGRNLDEAKERRGGGGGGGQRARGNCTLPVIPDFMLMFDCKE